MYRILVVDDEPMICKGLSKTIEKAQHIPTVVQTAEDGLQALDMIKTIKPHFVFTDIRMPKMDGLELCKQISERYPAIQLVVVSGYGEFEYAKKCISYGVSSYILKPITKQNVHEALQKLVDHDQMKKKSAVLTPLRVESWVESMLDSIWVLQVEQLEQVLSDWERELSTYHLTALQLKELLIDFFTMLIKELAKKGVELKHDELKRRISEEKEEEELLPAFNQTVRAVLLQLKELRKSKGKDMIEEAKSYIEQHLAREVSLEEVAEMLGLNPSYFSQYFKTKTNETFIQYRIKRRMEKAKRLLEMPHYRITDISHEIGYADHPHFTKTFKKVVGVSPSEYRRMLGIE